MSSARALDRGRESFARRAWDDAYAQLSAADAEVPLEPDDLERLATAAHLIGRDAESSDVLTRAHRTFLDRGDVERAARCAFWLAFGAIGMGELARGAGWLARARRILDDGRRDCVEQGYLLFPAARRCIMERDFPTAYATFSQAAAIGERFGDADLVTLARHGQGRALINLGRVAEGLALLDEALVAVTVGEVSPPVVGSVYCSAIEACQDIFDLRRAQEWTAALSRWCEAQPSLVAYRGACLVRRAEIMQLHGAWQDAMDEVRRASERLSESPGGRAVGAVVYQQAELHRLRGEFERAEEAYRRASQWGRKPQPGLAQLRLAQGQVDAAAAAVRGMLDEVQERRPRSNLLATYVEIMIAAGDVAAARAAADELARIAAELDAPFLGALSAHACGAVLLAEGDARAALGELRRAWGSWQEIEAPYEAARVRTLIGLCCRALGDEDTASMELDAARCVFRQLGAAPDLARVEAALSRKAATGNAGGLTAREVQVLRLVAAGKTNRSIAASLVISEKTVARHVSNIFMKLGVPTRAAATAYAYQHDLV